MHNGEWRNGEIEGEERRMVKNSNFYNRWVGFALSLSQKTAIIIQSSNVLLSWIIPTAPRSHQPQTLHPTLANRFSFFFAPSVPVQLVFFFFDRVCYAPGHRSGFLSANAKIPPPDPNIRRVEEPKCVLRHLQITPLSK